MKRLILLMAGLLTTGTVFSQAIDDRAVIPVSITLNSILRLNVTSGGNIEFNFNTLEDFQNGLNEGAVSAAYQTSFTVASSVNWNVNMYAEDATLLGTDIAGAPRTLALNNIGYSVASATGAQAITDFNAPSAAAVVALTNAPATVLVGYNSTIPNAGDIIRNSFVVHWRAGTSEGNMNGASILSQGVAADRYSTNVFLVLQPAP